MSKDSSDNSLPHVLDSPVPKLRRVSNLSSSSKVRTPFKSPLRSPLTSNSSRHQSQPFKPSPLTPTYKTLSGSPIAGNSTPNRPRALKRKSFSFNSPLKTLKTEPQQRKSIDQDIQRLEKEIEEQEEEISTLESEGYCSDDLELYIEKLHQYNEIKDTAQLVIGRVAIQRQTTTRALYPEFALHLED